MVSTFYKEVQLSLTTRAVLVQESQCSLTADTCSYIITLSIAKLTWWNDL